MHFLLSRYDGWNNKETDKGGSALSNMHNMQEPDQETAAASGGPGTRANGLNHRKIFRCGERDVWNHGWSRTVMTMSWCDDGTLDET
jgi:hypothetical protein